VQFPLAAVLGEGWPPGQSASSLGYTASNYNRTCKPVHLVIKSVHGFTWYHISQKNGILALTKACIK